MKNRRAKLVTEFEYQTKAELINLGHDVQGLGLCLVDDSTPESVAKSIMQLEYQTVLWLKNVIRVIE